MENYPKSSYIRSPKSGRQKEGGKRKRRGHKRPPPPPRRGGRDCVSAFSFSLWRGRAPVVESLLIARINPRAPFPRTPPRLKLRRGGRGGGRERSSFHTRMLKFVSVSVEVAFAPRFPDRLVVARPDRPINSQNINHDFPSLTLTLLLSLSVSSLLWMACPGWPSAIVRKLFTTS